MNIGNILKVADAIEQASIPDLGFNIHAVRSTVTDKIHDMSGHGCGTAACISGWACEVIPDACDRDMGDVLGLDPVRFYQLVTPDGWFDNPNQYTDKHAVRCLRNLVITGKVDWDAAMQPDEPQMPSLPSPTKAKQYDRA